MKWSSSDNENKKENAHEPSYAVEIRFVLYLTGVLNYRWARTISMTQKLVSADCDTVRNTYVWYVYTYINPFQYVSLYICIS